ncbi:MAG: Uma2 family endonuclease [Chloroflexi bacterium]|nr:Uma2 family endonuclease [Ardenticatenaceae bacterium]MBL1128719.1 Uma2 family endonuclease [Chloroflexota bacterium]NOG34797.1 Uma2 family endonuclease [Chloroflexota bacterium]
MSEMMLTPLEPILKSPKLPLYARALQSYLDEEHYKRESFYDWLTEDIKAEFINGEVVVQTPAKKQHTDAVVNLTSLLRTFVDEHDLGFLGSETVLVALTRNDYLPDVAFYGVEKSKNLSPQQVKYPAPDFVAEVLSPGTEHVDRGIKFEDYAAHGVGEYWILDPEKQTVEQYVLRQGGYELLFKIQEGSLTSTAVTGFTIPVVAIFDAKRKNQVLAQMIQ